MKLLASDYDGTLNTDIKNLRVNINYIKKFRKNGHKFMIITGRSFNSIKAQIETFNIPYDYLSCNDGAVLFDTEDNALFVDYLMAKDIEILLGRISSLYITSKLELYGMYGKTESLNNVIEISVRTKPFTNKEPLFNLLNEYELSVIKVLNSYYIENIGGKSRSIKYLSEKENFDEIITVGDSKNDIEMLRDYNGYRMIMSSPLLYSYNLKTTSSVKSLIKKHI